MADIENVIEQETEINNVVDKLINEQQQQAIIEPIIAEEIHEEKIEKENLTNIHTFLFDILAFFSNFQSSSVVEYCQETQNWNYIQHFLNDENTHILPIFFCDLQERFRFSKRSSIILPQLNQSVKTEESCIGIGIDKPFEDGGVIFLKPNTIKLTDKNFKNELVIFSMNFDQQNLDLMINLETILLSYLPSIKKANEWNKLNLFNDKTDQIKLNLIYQLEQNAKFFRTIHKSFIDCIQLQKVPIRLRHDTQEIINPNSLLRFVQDTELVQQAEETIIEWIKDIDHFYRKSTLVRQILSDSGPLNEIEYWRKQIIQLNHLVNQLRLPSNRAVIYLLNIAANPRSIEWREIDKKLTQCINEARDHYKFLMIVAKHIGPLYRNDPREIQENLNSLLNTIVLINSCSEFYSKPEKIASLLVSINNQMVISCKNYLTNNHTIDIRILDRKELLKRIDYIHNLYKTYREIFIKIKQKIENHYLNNTNDHLSEHHLFGQLDFLNQRLTSLREIIQSFDIYSLLSKSRMNGLEQITYIYNKIQTEFLTFKFNLFDSNDKEFDLFYNQLNHILSDIDQKLYQILDKDLHYILHSPSHYSYNALKLLLRYENLHIPFFDSIEFLIDIIQWYEKEELEKVKIIYNQCRNIPNIERDHPLIIGRILWARRMYKRIQISYVEFLKRNELKDHPIMKKITENFLMIVNGFSLYELLYHRHWYNTLGDVVNLLCNPLLIRQNLIRQLYINYDPFIDVILRECELLARYSITIPDLGYKLLLDRNRIRFYYERLKKLLKDFSILLAKAHPTSYELVEKVMTQVDNTLSIGLNRLNWLSKNLDELFLPAEEKISLMSDFLSQISSLIIHRIEEPINEVSRFEILEFPDDSIDFKQFINDIRQQIIFKAEKLNSLSMQIESAVLHVIQMFFNKIGYKSKPFEQKIGDIDLMQLSSMQRLAIQMFVRDPLKSIRKSKNPNQFILQPSNEWERFNELCNEFLSSFEARLIEALTLCAKNTFEMIKNRANPTLIKIKSRLKKLRLYSLDTNDANIDRKDNIINPLILTNVELHSSIIILNPNIDEIQQLMHQLVNYVLNIFHGVRKWGEVRHIDSKLIHNYPMHDFSDLLPTDETLEINKMSDNEEENLRHIEQAKTYYNTIANNKELTKLYQNIGTFFIENHIRFEKELEEYYEFRDLWEMNKINQAKKFILANPSYASVRSIFADFDDTRDLIKRIPESKDIDPFRYLTNKLKLNLFDEIRQLELIFAKYIRIHYRMKFMSINDFFKKTEPRLNRQLRDLDDVRFVINALDTLKENFVFVDHTIEPLEEVYNLFKRYSIDIPQEEQMTIEMLRSTNERLLKRAKHVTHDLVNSQQSFLDRFLIDIKQFQNDIIDFVNDYDNNGPMIEGLPAQEASDRLTHFESRFNDLWKRYETFVAGEELFGLNKTEYIHLQTIKKQLNYLKRLYGLYNDVIKTMEIYYETNWKDFHIDHITNEIQEFQNKMKKLPKGLKTWPAYSELKKKLDNFNECLPLLELLINPAMQSRHWERIEKLAKISVPHDDPSIFSLKHVMNVPLIKYREDIEDISITAQKERDIESKLFSIEYEWRQREFKFTLFKNRGELLLRGQETSEILSAIDDSNLILAALASNRYNIFFKNQIQKYIADLAICAEILTKWMQVQNLWIYLEAVFVGGDIGKQMPQEARRFANVDKTWIKLMSKAKENSNVLSCCTSDETLFPLLNNMLEQLELCQKSLAGYLETKRGVFPRFYFLSDPVMLEILGQASDPTKIQPYLSSFTEAVKFVEFHVKETDRILSMTTRDDEKIPFYKDVIAKGQVEEWLNDFIRTHQKTIHQYIRYSIEKMTYEDFDLYKFIEQEIAQLGLLIVQIIWTKRSEKALQESIINKNLMNETNKYFLDILNQFIDKTTFDLTKYQRLKYETLITIHLHQRDIFQELYTTGIRSDLDFDWAKQCRFYFREDEDLLLVKITDVTFIYDNEALGCPERLVITPLTDRCYISIAQALAMSYGASPAGPAGTGKTETTKDMARTLGKYCIVQNCSDQFDYRGLGKTFKGLAISGCWGCFDEFNRINLPVLSVAAQQIQCLLQAKRERRKEFLFTDGDKIILNDTFAIIITMNPGYAGRQELPENLKINFRSIAMMVPDRQIIMRVKLASGGFLDNTNLAQKFFTLYKCCEDQLSKQVHYDYGLRNITAVLRTLGTVKQNLNSVLDDNKLLTLANGDRIPMASNVKLIFEVHNIDNASPATVSRCGMIFMSSTILPWRPIFQAWMNKQIKIIGIYIFEILEKHFDELFKLLITKCLPKMKVYECNYIKQIIDLLDGLLNKEIEYTKSFLERLTIFALIWSMGSLLELNDRIKIEQYFIHQNDIDIPKNISQGDSIFDYLVNDNGQWEHWSTRVEPWEYPKDEKIDFASILVPNIDNVRITYLINILSKQEKPVLLIGEPGTAKTVIITSYLKHYDSEQHLTRIINFSSITTSSFIQKTIENFVDKRVANTFGPSYGRKMTIFIDDINMPMINSWGDQEANEILRQLIEQKGFYSLTKPGDFLNIIDLQFLAAMCHPGGGRNDISERLKRHFFILNCTLPSNNTIDHIFSSIGKYFCLERNFSNDFIQVVQKSISATRTLWQSVKGKFLPTPAKFHYIFNLRDLSRIWEGILQIDSEQCQNNIEQYIQLWKHECTRVLADRLILNTEKEWFRKEQYRIGKQTFGDIYNISIQEDSEVYFANFLREELEVTDEMDDDIDLADLLPKVYEPISSWDILQTKLMTNMTKMNEEIRGSNMDLVFFKDAMIHLLRISRVINMPKGHLLLIGVGGSGKQSLTKLAAYIAGYKYFQISVSRTYTLNNFLDDLRNIYRRATRLGQGIVFIITDNDIKDDQFLEYLNNVLSSGEVSGLITREEMDETLSELSVKMKKEYPKRILTNENLQNYYYERLRKNLHIVLCFSPDNRKFRERALKFPALVSGCTIDWFHRWPLDALIAVSNVYLNRFDILVTSNTIKKNIIELMADIHDDVSRICENYYEKFRRRTYVTPKSFLSFINAFKLYYQKQREYFEKEKQKMKTGVQKLFEAAEQVQEITQELISKEKSMAIANMEAAKQVAEMEVLRSAAEIKTKEVQESKETAEILVKQVNEEKAIAEEELSAAEIILKEAEEAVKVRKNYA
ncbi:unnamed protein product [Rotaria sordida]|uniref:AAA+ ATPase domain-containing protein n=1 Tax=Rotaria sordida TaxID=392033 RepID=A0A815KU84_9BILA|nr:unnamed protein product [Rotaria sordida]